MWSMTGSFQIHMPCPLPISLLAKSCACPVTIELDDEDIDYVVAQLRTLLDE